MVKKILILICATFFIIGCKNNDSVDETVYWDIISQTREYSDFDVNMSYPYRFGGDSLVTDMTNCIIRNALTEPLLDIDCEISIDSVLNVIYKEKNADSVIKRIHYELNSSGSVHEIDNYTSIMLFTYYYMGGANGIANTQYLNIDDTSGDLVPVEEIIDLNDYLLDEVRRKFCIIRDVSIESTAEDAKMFIAPKDLPFPKQIGFNSQGVVFYYNFYEVASRYFGATEIIIPYEDVTFLEL